MVVPPPQQPLRVSPRVPTVPGRLRRRIPGRLHGELIDIEGVVHVELSAIDIGFFFAFFLFVVGFSMYKSRREKSSEDYFLPAAG